MGNSIIYLVSTQFRPMGTYARPIPWALLKRREGPIDKYSKDVEIFHKELDKQFILDLLSIVRRETFPTDPLVIQKAQPITVKRKNKNQIRIESPRPYLARLRDLIVTEAVKRGHAYLIKELSLSERNSSPQISIDKIAKKVKAGNVGLIKKLNLSERNSSLSIGLDKKAEIDFEVTRYLQTDFNNLYLKLRSPAAIRAKKEITYAFLPFVISLAKRFEIPEHLDDLVGAGNIGLVKSIDKFDTSRKTNFSTCAAYWIRAQIKKYISENLREFRMNAPAFAKMQLIKDTEKEMIEKNRIIPTNNELHEEVKKSRAKFEGPLRDKVITKKNIITFRTLNLIESMSLTDLMFSHVEDNWLEIASMEREPLDQVIEDEIATKLLEKLDSRKISILVRKYGLRGTKALNNIENAKIHKITKERLRQLVNESLEELRKMTDSMTA